MMGESKKSHPFLIALFAAISILHIVQSDLCDATTRKRISSFSDELKASFFVSTCKKPRYMYISVTASSLDFRSTSLVHLSLLLLLSGQVETNPGPPTNGTEQEYPCAVCGDSVHDNDPAILCDMCNYWYHISCVGISARSYDQLLAKSRRFAWNCFQCGSINIDSTTSLQGLDFTDVNSFSPLDDSQPDSPVSTSFPVTSTPTRTGSRSTAPILVSRPQNLAQQREDVRLSRS